MRAFLYALASAALVLVPVARANADTIYMKNGSVIRGTVVGYTGGEFTVLLNSTSGEARSRATLVVGEIDHIEFDAARGDTGASAVPPPRDTGPAPSEPPPPDESAQQPSPSLPS